MFILSRKVQLNISFYLNINHIYYTIDNLILNVHILNLNTKFIFYISLKLFHKKSETYIDSGLLIQPNCSDIFAQNSKCGTIGNKPFQDYFTGRFMGRLTVGFY